MPEYFSFIVLKGQGTEQSELSCICIYMWKFMTQFQIILPKLSKN